MDGAGARLPRVRGQRARYVNELGLSAYEIDVQAQVRREMADFFEAALGDAKGQRPQLDHRRSQRTAEPRRSGHDAMPDFCASGGHADAHHGRHHLQLRRQGSVSVPCGQKAANDAIIEAKLSDSSLIEALVDTIIKTNADKVAEYRSGKDKLFGFFVGIGN